MITADTLRQCAYLNTLSLEKLLREGYPEDLLISSEFVGITNGGQFCYSVLFPTEDGVEKGKVFVWTDNGQLKADY